MRGVPSEKSCRPVRIHAGLSVHPLRLSMPAINSNGVASALAIANMTVSNQVAYCEGTLMPRFDQISNEQAVSHNFLIPLDRSDEHYLRLLLSDTKK